MVREYHTRPKYQIPNTEYHYKGKGFTPLTTVPHTHLEAHCIDVLKQQILHDGHKK
jgi:hypothetical protein